jgi:hypothetical protein
MSDPVENFGEYDPDGTETFKTDIHGRLERYIDRHDRGPYAPKDRKRFKHFWEMKRVLPAVRSNERKGVGLARFIVKKYLASEQIYLKITDGLPDQVALNVWKNAFKTLAIRHNEMRAAIDEFIRKGGLDDERWGPKDVDVDVLTYWTANYPRSSNDKREGELFPFYHNIYSVRNKPELEFPYRNEFSLQDPPISTHVEYGMEDLIPIGTHDKVVAPLELQAIRSIAKMIVEQFLNHNEILIDAADSLPPVPLRIAIWKDAFFRLGRRVIYDRTVMDDIAHNSGFQYVPGENVSL